MKIRNILKYNKKKIRTLNKIVGDKNQSKPLYEESTKGGINK